MRIALDKVAWDKALKELYKCYKKDKKWKWKRFEAEVSSLSALFISDFSPAARQVAHAMEIEPFNPLHRYRLALLYMRFARWDEALLVVEELVNLLPGLSYPLYLRALIYLRTGEINRSGNIANEIKMTGPDFKWANFLNVEVKIRQKFKGAEGQFMELPKNEKYYGVWTDLLIKTIIAHPDQGAKVVEGFLKRSKVLPEGSIEEKCVAQIIEWNTTSADVIKEYLVKIPAGSKTEQLALLFFHDHLKKSCEKFTYLKELKQLYLMLPQRNAVRRVYIAALNRFAVEEAAENKYQSALAAVEICLRLEPFNMIHYQNRATLFTLLREKKAYHRSWEEVERHHYRLALLGRIDRQSIRLLAKRHRMFAQQARFTPKLPDAKHTVNLGIFREEQTHRNGVQETILAVNQQRLDADPDQLRQWIHHRKAELFFTHLGIGMNPHLFLLGYTDDFSANMKLKGLGLLGKSLAVLAGDEGRLLSQHIEKHWQELVRKNSCVYSKTIENQEVQFLRKSHLENLGDLALLCFRWQPKTRDSEIVDELIEFIEAGIPFLEAQTLFDSSEKKDEEDSYSIRLLRQVVVDALDLEKTKSELSGQEQKRAGKYLTDYLLLHLSINVFEESGSTAPKDAASRALKILERARGEIPDNPEIEYFAARFFYIGDFYEETRKAISRFYKINKDDESKLISQIEELQAALDKAEKGDSKYYIAPKGHISQDSSRYLEEQVNKYREELERYPSSIQSYENLTHLLVSDCRFKEALEWSERAIGRCLSRKGQLKARVLNIELLGLQQLGSPYINEIKLYLKGVYTPLKEAVEQMRHEKSIEYVLVHLLGICLLAEGQPQEAQRVFKEALETCDKSIHFTVLRTLSSDIQQVFYTMTKETIEQFIADQRYEKAFEFIAERIQKLKSPELMIEDLAAVQLSAVIANLKYETKIPAIPPLIVQAPWSADLTAIIQDADDLQKARGLTLLAMEIHSPSKNKCEEMIRQIDKLKLQVDIASALTLSGKYLQEGNHKEALQALDTLGEAGNQEPRALRQRAMLLLKLEEFEQADQVVTRLESFEEPLAKNFVMRYPSLKSWQKISKVQYLLRKGQSPEALEILSTLQTVDVDEQLEASYCHGFALALQGYQARSEGQHNAAIQFFNDALDKLEPQIESARQKSHNGLLELYEKLSKDMNDLQEELHGHK
jgi:tetratricopeptide (TPR) repeat protein